MLKIDIKLGCLSAQIISDSGFIVRKISNNGYGEGLDMYDMILGEVSKK